MNLEQEEKRRGLTGFSNTTKETQEKIFILWMEGREEGMEHKIRTNQPSLSLMLMTSLVKLPSMWSMSPSLKMVCSQEPCTMAFLKNLDCCVVRKNEFQNSRQLLSDIKRQCM